MNKTVWKILKDIGMLRFFILILLLRLPFDFLNGVISANMLESFIRLAEKGQSENLLKTFGTFLLFTVLLFGYNVTIWAAVSVKADMLLQKRLRNRLLNHILSRNGEEMAAYSAGDLITRLNNDVDRVNDYLTTPVNFMHTAIASFNILFSSVILLILNPSLYILTSLVTVPFFILSSIIIIRKIPYYRKKSQESYADYTNWIEPVINAKESITVFDGEEIVLKKVEEASKEILRQNVKAHTLTAWSSFFNIMSGNLGYVLLLLCGNSMMGVGVKDYPQLLKITQYRAEMMKGSFIVNAGLNGMKTNLSGAARIEEILESDGEKISGQ